MKPQDVLKWRWRGAVLRLLRVIAWDACKPDRRADLADLFSEAGHLTNQINVVVKKATALPSEKAAEAARSVAAQKAAVDELAQMANEDGFHGKDGT